MNWHISGHYRVFGAKKTKADEITRPLFESEVKLYTNRIGSSIRSVVGAHYLLPYHSGKVLHFISPLVVYT